MTKTVNAKIPTMDLPILDEVFNMERCCADSLR